MSRKSTTGTGDTKDGARDERVARKSTGVAKTRYRNTQHTKALCSTIKQSMPEATHEWSRAISMLVLLAGCIPPPHGGFLPVTDAAGETNASDESSVAQTGAEPMTAGSLTTEGSSGSIATTDPFATANSASNPTLTDGVDSEGEATSGTEDGATETSSNGSTTAETMGANSDGNTTGETTGDIADYECIYATCSIEDYPRIMFLLDASSSLLNNGSSDHAAEGESSWDLIRNSISGNSSSLDTIVDGGYPARDRALWGASVFGHNTPEPGEQKVLVQHGYCTEDNIEWALNPWSSCEAPGCEYPWSGSPISWTFKNYKYADPFFNQDTISHMPKCDFPGGNAKICSGSGTFSHLGLELVLSNFSTFNDFPADNNTPKALIYITDGQYNGYSTDGQVSAALMQMNAGGVSVYIVGFGDGVQNPQAQAQLSNMANWGSGGDSPHYSAGSEQDLRNALASIVSEIFSPLPLCCPVHKCGVNPEP